MKIEFNKVTWYSKLLAFIVCIIITPALFFYLGTVFKNTNQIRLDTVAQDIINQDNLSLTLPVKTENNMDQEDQMVSSLFFQCQNNKKFSIEYYQVENSPGPEAIYIPETRTSLSIKFDEQHKEYLLNQPSFNNSFSPYVNADKSVIFEIKNSQNMAQVKQNGIITYDNCFELGKD